MIVETLQTLTDQANALKAAGRLDDAIAVYARAVALAPRSGVAEHNLAAALGDAARFSEAEEGCRRALAKGLDAPETWLVLARARQSLQRLDDAEAGFREALKRRPNMVDAHRELAQLIWMRSENTAAATEFLDRTLASHGKEPELLLIKAKALEFAGDIAGAYTVVRKAAAARDAALHEVLSADLVGRLGDAQAAYKHAQRAVSLDSYLPMAQSMLAQTYLLMGEPAKTVEVLDPLRRRLPYDQFLLALQATAWRMLDDSRRHQLLDYSNLVRTWRLKTPPGWASLQDYLGDLAKALVSHHAFRTHPFGQSVRHGSQASDLLALPDPAIRAFPAAVIDNVDEHLQALGRGPDPVRSRNTGLWRFHGVWSVRLRPLGFHSNHVHPDGWISSACYIDLPAAVQGGGQEGWIKFGEPGVPTMPSLPPEHFVKPEPGLLVLFPSYMWHGTVPFSGADNRLTIAFDLVPVADT